MTPSQSNIKTSTSGSKSLAGSVNFSTLARRALLEESAAVMLLLAGRDLTTGLAKALLLPRLTATDAADEKAAVREAEARARAVVSADLAMFISNLCGTILMDDVIGDYSSIAYRIVLVGHDLIITSLLYWQLLATCHGGGAGVGGWIGAGFVSSVARNKRHTKQTPRMYFFTKNVTVIESRLLQKILPCPM